MKYARTFKVVLVTGARQVGKSTMLAHAFPEAKSVVFDPLQDILGAESDPDLFLENMGTPLILDEIQYAPRLLPALKRRVDRSGMKGQYFLTCSQNPSILRSVSESMAGRVGILQLEGMTPQEMRGEAGVRGWLGAWLKEPGKFASCIGGVNRARGPLVRDIWRGQLPGLLDEPDDMVFDYYRSYIQTYIERDARLLDNIRDLSSFSRLTGLAAALTAQEVNTAKFGRDVGVMPATARAWLDVLAHTYQWLELDAYSGNTVKRLSGKKKGHMSDTGVACALQRVTSPEALAVHPLLGALFETMVVGMLRAQFATLAVPPHVYHWRTNGGAELDVVLELDGKLYPAEVKCSTNITRHDASGIHAFRTTYGRMVQPGAIIYAGEECRRVDEFVTAVPWDATVRTGHN